MFITISAVLCSGLLCTEEIITDSSLDNTLTLQSCMIGEASVVKWMSEHPIYSHKYTLQRWKCTIGNRKPPAKPDRA